MTVWLKLQGAAEYCKSSREIVREAVRRGDLKAYTIGTGRDFRLKTEDIDAWLESQPWEPRP